MENLEKDWVKRLRQGDLTAANEIDKAYREKLEFFVKRKIGMHNSDCQDIVQETLAAALETIRNKKFDPNKCQLGTWIFGIMKNKINDHRKRQRRRGRVFDKLDDEETYKSIVEKANDSNPNQESELIKDEELGNLRNAIKQLSNKYKKILDLYINEELSINEIAKRLGLSPEKVSQLKFQAIIKIKKNME